jgi:hypothetical protein
MWMLFLGQMREGIGCADAGIDGQGKRTATMRHRNFQRGVDAHHSEFLCSNAKLPGRAAQCFERWFAYDVNAPPVRSLIIAEIAREVPSAFPGAVTK